MNTHSTVLIATSLPALAPPEAPADATGAAAPAADTPDAGGASSAAALAVVVDAGSGSAHAAQAAVVIAVSGGATPADVLGLARQIDYLGMRLDLASTAWHGAYALADYLLLCDGSIRRGWPQGLPLQDFDVGASLHREPALWGQWTTNGPAGQSGCYDVIWSDGSRQRLNLSFVLLARDGERLDGLFGHAGSAWAGAFGGSMFAYGWRELLFRADGSFEMLSGGGGDYHGQSGSVHTGQRESQQGRYRLSGNLLELRFEDGRVLRQAFAFSSAAKDSILVNGERMQLQA